MPSLPCPSLPMGIYALRNTLTGDCYVGSTCDLRRRWQNHWQALRRGQHYNPVLQAAWTRYGADAFTYVVLDYVDERNDLLSAEHQWIAALHPAYNLTPLYGDVPAAARRKVRRNGPWAPHTVARFWAKVRKSDDCWEWMASRKRGYGQFFLYKQRGTQQVALMQAHRFSYILAHGPIADDLLVLHTCDNRACVRPNHLTPGTHKANTADMIAKGRAGYLKGEAAPNHRRTVEQVLAMRQSYAAGQSLTAIARTFNVRRGTASDIVHGRSWKHVAGAQPVGTARVYREAAAASSRARGTSHVHAKLNDEAVRSSRARYAAGEATCRGLAREYGVLPRTMRQVLRHQTWRHIAP